MTASSATAAAGRVAMIDTARVVYFVNGAAVSKADAERLEAERIVSVNVLQRGTQSGGEVRIVTRDAGMPGDSARTSIDYVRTASSATVSFVTPGDSVILTADGAAKRAAESKPRIAATSLRMMDGPPRSGPPSAPAGLTRTGFTGLMIVDGVITDPAIANSLAPDQIVSVNILKGASATAVYSDPRAANGVIQITTKRGKS